MKRRHFLKATGSAMTLPFLLNGMNLATLSRSSVFANINDDTDRVLVLIQLNGGNDGLNMLPPLDQYDRLARVRANILIPQRDIIPVTGTLGFHPNLRGLKGVYDDGRLGIVQSVGYPNQNRSHFRSTDIWTTGSPADEFWTTGWLGRYFDGQAPGFPEGYPNAGQPDPFAITMGSIVSETCQGLAANFSLTLNDPFSLGQLATGEGGEAPDTPYGRELQFLRTTIAQTNQYAETIVTAAERGANLVDYPGDNRLAQQLRNVALLISGGLKTKVYVVNIGGFDTHANQVVDGAPTTGEHAVLLRQLSEAISVFLDDLKRSGNDRRVIGMTFSEFGRRIRSNASLGTDHGTAAPLLVFGSCVNPAVLGDNPEIGEEVDVQEGVPMQFDFRDVYGSVLKDWFGLAEADVRRSLYPDFRYLPVLQSCALTSTGPGAVASGPFDLVVFPNPWRESASLRFTIPAGWVRLSLYDVLGNELRVLMDRRLPAGEHTVPLDGGGLPAGAYICRLQMEGRVATKRLVKSR